MSRRGRVTKRVISGDPVYGSRLVQRFINRLMLKGRKSIAERLVYQALEIIAQKTKKEPLSIFEQAIENVRPLMEVKPRRVGGATYQVPVEVEKERGIARAMQWIRVCASERSGRSMEEKLASELLEASSGTGVAMKKRGDMHRMAEANKAFAHFRW